MKIAVIPDVQVKPDSDTSHLTWISKYLVEKKPAVIVQLGDFADMSSLSSYDVGKKSFEGRRYTEDIKAAHLAMARLMTPIYNEQQRLKRNKEKQWTPRLVLTLGNHENRIERAVENDSKLEGLLSLGDLNYERFGWEVVPYLQPVVISGIAFCHYFVSGVMGRPVTSARMLLAKHHMSCIAGHQQGRDIAYGKRPNGDNLIGLISGSCYLGDEEYLNPQTNDCWHGIWMLNEVSERGSCDELPVSLNYLRSKYGS
jgi:hypothetical protein